MKIGFVGTGAITEAIVRGILASGMAFETIFLSPRSADVAARLALLSPKIIVASDNQDVVDRAETVFLAIRPQIARDVIEVLKFRNDHKLVSLIAATEIDDILRWVGLPLPCVRAIPLPFVATLSGVTVIYPPDPWTADFFNALGNSVEVAAKKDFDVLGAGGAVMGLFFGLLETLAGWLKTHGLPYDQAQAYIGPLFRSLATVAAETRDKSFGDLGREFSTAGGLNEQVHRDFSAVSDDALRAALDGVLARIEGRS